MKQDWIARDPVTKSRVEILTHEIVQVYRDTYYALQWSKADQVATKRAREETTTRLVAVEGNLATQQSTWESERAALIAQLKAIKQEKESERTTLLA